MTTVLWHNDTSEIEPLNGTNEEYWLGAMRWLLQEHGLLSTVSSVGTVGHFDGERAGSIIVRHIHADYKHRYGFDPESVTAQEVFRAVEAGPRPFRFMNLPREIRDCVYEFVIVGLRLRELVDISARVPPLLQTTRQIRHEASAVYYKEIDFEWGLSLTWKELASREIRALERWAEAISPENRKNLKSLTLRVFTTGCEWLPIHLQKLEHMTRVSMSSDVCGCCAPPKEGRNQLDRTKALIDGRDDEERWKTASLIEYLLADESDLLSTLEGRFWHPGPVPTIEASLE